MRTSVAEGILWWGGVVLLSIWASDAGAQHHTYASLVERLLDLEGLAVLPADGERAGQWSSHSRVSIYDEGADRYVRWHDNGDRSGFVRLEDGGRVLAEMEGPGCIWRIWTADPRQGHVKVFVDGAAVPEIDLPFEDYFNGSSAPFDQGSLAYEAARGKNSYVPISYNRSCKIVGYGDWGEFFHFTYSTFPPGHTVESYSTELLPVATSALDAVDGFLRGSLGGGPAGYRSGEAVISANAVRIPAGGRLTLADISGQRAITRISLRVHNLQPHSTDAYLAPRELALTASWDDEPDPSLWAPVGDFFGSGPRLNTFASLPLTVNAGASEMIAHWYMPFAERGLVEIVNDGAADRTVSYDLTHAPLTRPIETLGRFHAKWNRNPRSLPERGDRWPDWVFLETEGGRGRYVGVTLHAWLKTSTLDDGFRCAVSFGNAEEGAAMFLAQDGEQLRAWGYLDDLEVVGFWEPDEWRFVCLTYDGSIARLYADQPGSGVVEEGSAAKEWELVPVRARIGRQVNQQYEFWNGKVDDVRVYNRQLSVDELVGVYRERYGGPTRVAGGDDIGEASLLQNRPNPFNLETLVEFSLPAGHQGRLTVHDVVGQVVRSFSPTSGEGGRFRVVWDGTDDAGRAVASGLYLVRLSEESGRQLVQKMLMVK